GVNKYAGDGGPAIDATLLEASNLAIDKDGNLFVVEADFRIRKISTNGIITTVAGSGTCSYDNNNHGDGGSATLATICPGGITVDGSGNLYIADYTSRAWAVSPDGVIHKIAGIGV